MVSSFVLLSHFVFLEFFFTFTIDMIEILRCMLNETFEIRGAKAVRIAMIDVLRQQALHRIAIRISVSEFHALLL